MAIDPKRRLRDCPEDQIGVSIPGPLNARLDALVARANHAGENTSRKELLAALILATTDDPEALVEAIRRFRTAEAGDVVPKGDDPAELLRERQVRPGPRPRKSQ